MGLKTSDTNGQGVSRRRIDKNLSRHRSVSLQRVVVFSSGFLAVLGPFPFNISASFVLIAQDW